MIPKSRYQEFGFADEDKFPRRLSHHAVSMSLPSAMDNGIEPLEVIVDDGLVVPLQKTGSSSGMIIRSDGMMLYVWHRDPKDPRSPLEARFIKEIPYDARAEVSNIMHRAVGADPTLDDIWGKVSAAWLGWFPVLDVEGAVQPAGEFATVAKAWDMMGQLMGRLIEKAGASSGGVGVKIIVQSEENFKQGWLGEENIVDETTLRAITVQGRVKYLLQVLFPKIQKVLRLPVFHPSSTFRLYYGSSSVYMIKLVVIAPVDPGKKSLNAAGIEFTLSSLDGFAPSLG